MILICPECYKEVIYYLDRNIDEQLTCLHCNTYLKLDYVGGLLETQYFLIRKERKR